MFVPLGIKPRQHHHHLVDADVDRIESTVVGGESCG